MPQSIEKVCTCMCRNCFVTEALAACYVPGMQLTPD